MAFQKQIRQLFELSAEEEATLEFLLSNNRRVPRRTELAHQGDELGTSYILQAGWAYCFKTLPNGSRQIIKIAVPGDILGLGDMLLWKAERSFATITNAVLTPISKSAITSLVGDHSRLGMAILWTLAREEAMMTEHLVNMGRRSAIERMAHFILELHDRLRLVGLTRGDEFECPLTQDDFGDTLGLTPVHVNRVLGKLREKEMLLIRSKCVAILDRVALKSLARYDPTYLYERGGP